MARATRDLMSAEVRAGNLARIGADLVADLVCASHAKHLTPDNTYVESARETIAEARRELAFIERTLTEALAGREIA